MKGSLFDLAEKSDSNSKQAQYLDSLQLINQAKNSMSDEFFETIQSVFDSFLNGQYNVFSIEEESNLEENVLSLVDNNKLEESLLKSTLIKKSEAAYHKHLFALIIRFSEISSIKQLKNHQVPIGPHILIHAFEQCINKLKIEIDIKIIMFKSFEMSVMGQMHDTYSGINTLFAVNGIVPNIQYDFQKENNKSASLYGKLKTTEDENNLSNEKTKKIHAQKPIKTNLKNLNKQLNNDPGLKNNDSNKKSHVKNLDENYQVISEMIGLCRKALKNSGQISPNNNQNMGSQEQGHYGNPIEMINVVNAITMMQSKFISDFQQHANYIKSPIDLKQQLLQQMYEMDSASKYQNVREADEDVIDLVGLLFQFIVDDRNLPNKIQALLAKLQLPYLKIALQDRNIFADKNHEARKLLDKLALSSVGWSQESDNNNVYINKLEDIINHILDVEIFSNRIFEILQINFDAFLDKMNKKSDVVVKRTKERAEGDAKFKYAKQQVADLMFGKMIGQPIPKAIVEVLINEWSSILILTHLRYAENSQKLNSFIGFVDIVIDISCSHVSLDKYNIIELLSVYEKGLKLIIFQKGELQEKKQELHDFFNDFASKPTMYEENLTLSQLELISGVNEIVSLMKLKNKLLIQNSQIEIEDKYIQKASLLHLGTWVIISDQPNKSIRAKLSWHNPVNGTYLFVNARGFKMIEKTKMQVAQGFKDKSIRILMQVALFDRALGSIATDLKQQTDNL